MFYYKSEGSKLCHTRKVCGKHLITALVGFFHIPMALQRVKQNLFCYTAFTKLVT
jgi:hypothetical protein